MSYIIGKIEYTGAKLDGKKALPLCILQILTEHSDRDHPMTSGDIIRRLSEAYGIEANRNTISRNIAVLRDLGFEISTYDENHKGAYLETREFDDMEIRWLIDGVLNSKYLPEKYANDLIAKLKALSSRHFKSGMDHISALREWPHQKNRAFSSNMAALDEAIEHRLRVRFTYNQMNCYLKLIPLNNKSFEVLPIRMFCTNSQYYLIANDFKHRGLTHFRLDRITELVTLKEAQENDCALYKKLDVDAVRYVREHPHMYGGDAVTVTLKMPRTLAGAVYDSFGDTVSMTALDETSMRVRVKAAAEGLRFFVLQYGPNCEVLEPASLREQIKKDIISMMERYGV